MEPRNKEIISEEVISETENLISQENENAAADEQPAAFCDEENQEVKKKGTLIDFFKGEFFTRKFKIVVFVFLFSLAVYIASRFIPAFAEFWTRYPAQGIRFIMAKFTGWIPFSVAECLILSIPVIFAAYITASMIATKRDESKSTFYKWIRPMVSVVLIIFSLFLSMFGPAYGRFRLSENLGIEQKDVSADELIETASIISEKVSAELENVSFDYSGASVMPYDYWELKRKINDAFEKYASDVDYISHFNSSPKPIAVSEVMTYTHISGVYTFMTGEANVNTNYPNFLMPFTMAHEMAHQRGIAREDEANFVAFLVCTGSDDAYIRYSGYANMLNYMLTAIANADVALYADFAVNVLPKDVAMEFVAYSRFFDKYRESVASDITGAVNNTFLQSQGQKEGTKSYGLVVDLAVAYYKQ